MRRHEQKVHKIFPPPPPQTVCDECLESFDSLSEAREHVELVHDMTFNSHCIYCHIIFLTAESYGQHLLKKHALPVWDGIETTSSAAPTESAFRGKLRRYNLKVGEKKGFASSHDGKQGGNRCSHTGKGQRGSAQGAIPCESGNDQNSHCARRGQWNLRKEHAVSEH